MEFYDEESTLWRVKRAVYGLKTSPREWQDCFARTLTKKLGMTRSRIDANLFTKTIGNELVMILVYVDDLFILGPHDESNEMLKLLQEHFTMKQTGELTKVVKYSSWAEPSNVTWIQSHFRHRRIMSQHWSICWTLLTTERHESQDQVHQSRNLMIQTL